MKTITKTINIYEFDELPKEIKEKVLKERVELIRNDDIDCCLYYEMRYWGAKLLEKYFKNKAKLEEVCYSLGYCQGDGAMIEFNLTYYNKYVKVIHDGGHYYHANSFTISGDTLTDKQYKQLREKIYNINKELEKMGYDYIEEDRTEQALEELKECMFYENGDIY